MLLAKRIKAIRLHKGLTQQDIADKLNITQATYSGYEIEAGNLKFNTITAIAGALNCSIPFLTDVHSTLLDESVWRQHH